MLWSRESFINTYRQLIEFYRTHIKLNYKSQKSIRVPIEMSYLQKPFVVLYRNLNGIGINLFSDGYTEAELGLRTDYSLVKLHKKGINLNKLNF